MPRTNCSNFKKRVQVQKVFGVLGDGIFISKLDSWGNAIENGLKKDKPGKCRKRANPSPSACFHMRIKDIQDLFQWLAFDSTCVYSVLAYFQLNFMKNLERRTVHLHEARNTEEKNPSEETRKRRPSTY
ncbi:hypothetical protein CK203_067415 [Vitis vinifera]|uniref:Uncharacterized protein n=1 Tax=Vitis vinifera TaxID=29760 RepID=A0A438EFR5_VITVI|nr:hypothetical protein CK203_067415 [Vitis vinifera]